MNRLTIFRSFLFVSIFLMTIRSGFSQNARFTGSMDIKVQSYTLIKGIPEYKPGKALKIFFKGDKILIDSINYKGKVVRLIIDQSTQTLQVLFLPTKETPRTLGGTVNLKFITKVGVKESQKTMNGNWAKIQEMKFTESKQKRTLDGMPVKKVNMEFAIDNIKWIQTYTLSVWMTEKAGLKLSDYKLLFSALSDTSFFDYFRNAATEAPSIIKNGWPLHIYVKSESKNTVTNVYFQNITPTLSPIQEALFDTSSYTMIDMEKVASSPKNNQTKKLSQPPTEDMNSAPSE